MCSRPIGRFLENIGDLRQAEQVVTMNEEVMGGAQVIAETRIGAAVSDTLLKARLLEIRRFSVL